MRINENEWEWIKMNEDEWESAMNEWDWMKMNENEWERPPPNYQGNF